MRNTRRGSMVLAAGAALAAAGCRTAPPPAERVVYEVREVPVVVERVVVERDVIPPRAVTVVRDDPDTESRRRAWLDQHYGSAPAPTAQPAPDRYVPQVERVRERVIVVDREPRWVVPPPTLNIGYWGGSRRHHGGWHWGVGWGFPLWW